MVEISINMPVTALLFFSVVCQSVRQTRLTIGDENAAVGQFNLVFFPFLVDIFPTVSGIGSQGEHLTGGVNADNNFQVPFPCLVIDPFSLELGAIRKHL